MAGKGGGGSWKVAYADFVTAMMAFFLVMWIGAQDQKTRQSVANYFVDPSGVSKKPARTGAVLDSVTYGTVPEGASTAMNRGRESYDKVPGEPSQPTLKVSNWLLQDDKRSRLWRDRARAAREAAAKSPEVLEKGASVDEVTNHELSKMLRTEFSAGVSAKPDDIYRELVYGAIEEVNWTQIAQDIMK
ncbi:MAG: motB [Gemmataceae bacterium]|nr:motB [Gemmataceae bacterium]